MIPFSYQLKEQIMKPNGCFLIDIELPLDTMEPTYISEMNEKWPMIVDYPDRAFGLLTLYIAKTYSPQSMMIVDGKGHPRLGEYVKVTNFSKEEFLPYVRNHDCIISRAVLEEAELDKMPLDCLVITLLGNNIKKLEINKTIYCPPYTSDFYYRVSHKKSRLLPLRHRKQQHLYRRRFSEYDEEMSRLIEDEKGAEKQTHDKIYNQAQAIEDLVQAINTKDTRKMLGVLQDHRFHTKDHLFRHRLTSFYLNIVLNDSAYIMRSAVATSIPTIVKFIMNDNRIDKTAMDNIAMQDALIANKKDIINLFDEWFPTKVPGSLTLKTTTLYYLSAVLKKSPFDLPQEHLKPNSILVRDHEIFISNYKRDDLDLILGKDLKYMPYDHLLKVLLVSYRETKDPIFAKELVASLNTDYKKYKDKW